MAEPARGRADRLSGAQSLASSTSTASEMISVRRCPRSRLEALACPTLGGPGPPRGRLDLRGGQSSIGDRQHCRMGYRDREQRTVTGLSEVNALATAAQWQGFRRACLGWSPATDQPWIADVGGLDGAQDRRDAGRRGGVHSRCVVGDPLVGVHHQPCRNAGAERHQFHGHQHPAIIERETEYYGRALAAQFKCGLGVCQCA